MRNAERGRAKRKTIDGLTATVDHLPILAGETNGDPGIRRRVGHGNVAVGISLMLLGGD